MLEVREGRIWVVLDLAEDLVYGSEAIRVNRFIVGDLIKFVADLCHLIQGLHDSFRNKVCLRLRESPIVVFIILLKMIV